MVVNDWWKEACVFGKVLFAQFSNCMWFVTHFNDSMNGTARHAISIPSQPCLSSNLVWFPSRSGNWLSSGLDWPLWKATSTAVEYTWNVFKMITIIFIVVRIGISISITINIWSNSDPRLESPQSSLLPWPLLSYDQNEIWISIYCKIHIEFFVSTISKITCFFFFFWWWWSWVWINLTTHYSLVTLPPSPKDNMLLK